MNGLASSHTKLPRRPLKRYTQSIGVEGWGHSVSRMLENLPENFKPLAEIINMAKEMDRHYIPSSYLNFHSEGAPLDYYTRGMPKEL
ncbi:MAG: HEPN domain-containing protein [Candidatus Bathyarchaeia archaeon]